MYDELCSAPLEISVEAMEVHNITPDVIANQAPYGETAFAKKVVDHLFCKKIMIYFVYKIRRYHKKRDKLQHKKVGKMFKNTFVKVKPRFHATSFRELLIVGNTHNISNFCLG